MLSLHGFDHEHKQVVERFRQLDLLAIPDFASGAMENLGAITFRETALLVDQRTGTPDADDQAHGG